MDGKKKKFSFALQYNFDILLLYISKYLDNMAKQYEITGDLGYNGFPISLNYITHLPDISTLYNSEVVVIFKSLMKRDPKTKEKALNDLLTITEIDDPTIVAWLQVYPKLALDNSRSVRLLSHQIQGNFLKIVGGKKYSKYLKSSIPIWLMGIFDTDKSVSSIAYKTLLQSFQGDVSKLNKTWNIFEEQIINLIGTLVSIESMETLSDRRYTSESEMVSKYDRGLVCAINMLSKLLDENIVPILEEESLWDHLSNSLKEDNMDLVLFKNLLLLITNLSDDNLQVVYKLVSKKFIKIKFKSNKISGSIIYSNVIIPFWQAIVRLTEFGIRNKLKKNFWDLAGSKSSTRFYEYLKLGPCNLDPSYYQLIVKIFQDLQKLDVVDFNSQDEYDYVINLLLKQYSTTMGTFKAGALDCALKILNLFTVESTMLVDELILQVLKSLASIRSQPDKTAIVQTLKNNLSSGTEKVFNKLNKTVEKFITDANVIDSSPKSFLSVYFDVLKQLGLQSQLDNLVRYVCTDLLDESEDLNLEIPFFVIKLYLNNMIDPIPEVTDFLVQLPAFVEEDFITPILDILNIAIAKKLLQNEDELDDIVNDFYLKLTMVKPEKIDYFIQNLGITIDEKRFPEIYSHLTDVSKKEMSKDQIEMIVKSTKDKDVLLNVIKSLDSEDAYLKFIELVVQYNLLSIIIDLDISQLLHVAWIHLNVKFLTTLKEFKDIYLVSMIEFIKLGSGSLSEEFYKFVKTGPLPIEQFKQRTLDSISKIDIFSVAISNPLGLAVYLCQKGKTPLELDEFIPSIGKFLNNIDGQVVDTLLLLIKEYLADYILLKDNVNQDVVDVLSNLQHKISKHFKNFKFGDLINEKTLVLEELWQLVERNDVHAFYAARIIKRAVEDSLEFESLSSFESFDINYTKLVKTPFKFVSLVGGFSKFLNSKKLDRIRNYVLSEILAVKKEEQIITDGIKWIVLSLVFFNTEVFATDVYPIHKLTMVLSLISDWLDSSVAYDNEFIDLRVLICCFLGVIILKQTNIPDNYYELAKKVFENNFEIIQLEPNRLDLNYYTLKFYIQVMNKDMGKFDEELIDIFLNFNASCRNQATILVEQTIARVLRESSIEMKIIQSKKSSFFKLFTSSKSVSVQRICAWYLRQIILLEQQEFVVEYQLSKNDEKELQARIPDELIKIVNHTLGHQEYEVFQYMWSWVLILSYMEDITLKMKNEYIGQLVQNKELPILFDFVFEYLHVEDESLFIIDSGKQQQQQQDTENNIIPNYDLIETGKSESSIHELKLLAGYIYFKCAQLCGSQVQLWYQEIRDKQFKNIVEKFTVKFIAPILVKDIKENVGKEIGKLEQNEVNIKIGTNQIKANISVEEENISMRWSIPSNYPLSNVSVEGPLCVGVKENQWKAWLLASQKIISLTNGSITKSIELFCKNVNLHFSGFEDCAICYSILHQDSSLPSKNCTTCSNKFHAACLYKWFKSSGSSTCPLCRSTFNFRR